MEQVEQTRYMSTQAVAKIFGTHTETVRRGIKQGDLPAVRFCRHWYIPTEYVQKLEATANSPKKEAKDEVLSIDNPTKDGKE